MSNVSNVPEEVLERIQNLFKLATKNSSEGESTLALKKANELLERYNLDHAALGGQEFGSGARARQALEGGFHQWQRDLWKEVSALNFVWYWNSRDYNYERTPDKYGTVRTWKHKHHLIGRKVNIAATQAMASYLADAATRLAKERTQGINPAHTLGNWANSYRYGIVQRICRKLRERRAEAVKAEAVKAEEEKLAAQARAADGQVSTSSAVSILVYHNKEMDANYDFAFGEGWSAKRAAEIALDARYRRMSKDEKTRWAAEHPEEARAAEARVRQRRRGGGGRDRDVNLDRSAYWAGYEAGAHVSIDPQVDTGKMGRLGR